MIGVGNSEVVEGSQQPSPHRKTLKARAPNVDRWKDHHNSDYRNYVCGCGAAIVNICVTYPINKIIFRQMLHGHSVKSAAADLRAEGFRFLYRGVGPPLIQRSTSLSLMFGTFSSYLNLLNCTPITHSLMNDYARFCFAAFLAGSTEALLCPFERIQMLLQV